MLSILVMKIHHNLPSIAVLPFLLVIARMASCYHSRGPLVNGRFPVQEVSSSRSGTSIPRVLRQDGPDFPNVVLAFPATLSRPVTRLGRPVSELPLKKRIFKHLRNSFELKKENASEKGEVMLNKTAVTEENVNAIPFSGSSEMKDSKKHKSCQFISNRESSIPCPNIGGPKPKEKENAKVLPAKALLVKRNEVEKQRRGQLKKSSKASRGGMKRNIYVLD